MGAPQRHAARGVTRGRARAPERRGFARRAPLCGWAAFALGGCAVAAAGLGGCGAAAGGGRRDEVAAPAPRARAARAADVAAEGTATDDASFTEGPAPATAMPGGAASAGATRALAREPQRNAPGTEPARAPGAPEVGARVEGLEVAPQDAWAAPSTACQDVLVYVREGSLEAHGAGVADADSPATLYAGDAVRFGPEGDGVVRNVGAGRARTVVVYARRSDRGAPRVPADAAALARLREEDGQACALEPRAEGTADGLRRGARVAFGATTPEQVVAGGALRVRILLDRGGQGAAHAGLARLEGTPDARVPEHRHPESAEILYVEDGDGHMRLGDEELRVRPGAVLVVPRGVLHDFRGAGTRPLRALQVYAPSGPEQRFRQ